MSLTSYRAAPPRGDGLRRVSWSAAAGAPWSSREQGGSPASGRAFCRFGGDLLSRVLGRSTIGAAALNGRVRDGIGCFARAMAAKPAERAGSRAGPCAYTRPRAPRPRGAAFLVVADAWSDDVRRGRRRAKRGLPSTGSDQACRAISTGQLNASPRLHLRPIDVVVFHGPQGRPGFEGGFPLRCLQRLSCPHIATLRCGWRHNRSTSGAFTPVLSY